ncbi:hypothetical protein Glove_87g263 [Diversispora epigaea]|uniref:Uncharacterized protein n=1 Tax=Diversispora epigaea TaxID=1348612 RepID=A0A397J8G5_9GLOM|nr:hypothetical protein Glove_87g263 [Diversispora epigaea]
MRENDEINESNGDDDIIERPKITCTEVTSILNTLELFFLQQDENYNNLNFNELDYLDGLNKFDELDNLNELNNFDELDNFGDDLYELNE